VLEELVQPVGQDVLRDPEALLELGEAAQAEERVAHDEQRPPVPDLLEGLGDSAVHGVETGSGHGALDLDLQVALRDPIP
jgi:hypothetical protein